MKLTAIRSIHLPSKWLGTEDTGNSAPVRIKKIQLVPIRNRFSFSYKIVISYKVTLSSLKSLVIVTNEIYSKICEECQVDCLSSVREGKNLPLPF